MAIAALTRSGSTISAAGAPIRFVGANAYWLGLDDNAGIRYPSHADIDNAVAGCQALGVNYVRSHTLGFSFGSAKCLITGYNQGADTLTVNSAAWEPIDYAERAFGSAGIYLELPLCDQYGYYHGGKRDIVSWLSSNNGASVNGVTPTNTDRSVTVGNSDTEKTAEQQFYTNSACRTLFKKFIALRMNHVNQYTGVASKANPGIIWSLGNELWDVAQVAYTGWTQEIAAYIKTLTTVSLVDFGGAADGVSLAGGPYNYPTSSTPHPGTTAPAVDLVGVHMYTEDASYNPAPLDLTVLASNVSTAAAAGKAFMVGEYAWSRSNRDAFLDWIVAHPQASGSAFWALIISGETHGGAYGSDDAAMYYPTVDSTTAAFKTKLISHSASMMGGTSMTAKLRLNRVTMGVRASTAKLRLNRLTLGTQVGGVKLRLNRVTMGVQVGSVAFSVSAVSSAAGPVTANTLVTLSATATPPPGDSVAGWSWTALSPNSPPLSSSTAQNPTFRGLPVLAARTLQYKVTVTTRAGASASAVVNVAAAQAPFFTVDVSGKRHAFSPVGVNPNTGGTPPPPPPPPPGSANLRLTRLALGVQGTAVVVDPPPAGTNTTLLVGARVNLPGNTGTPTSWFAAGEARWGPLQCTKDYLSGSSLPPKYVSPYPSRVTVLLSFARGINLDPTLPNWSTFIRTIPSGTILTFQHEPERPGMYAGQGPAYVNLFNTFRDNVRAIRTDLPVWMFSSGFQYRVGNPGYSGTFFTGNKADGFSYDGYRAGTNTQPQGLLVNPMQNRDEFNRWRSFIPRGKPWGVSETGFGRSDYPPNYAETGLYPGVVDDRRTSCLSTYNWLLANGATMLLLFFSGDGPDLHNWFPSPSETAFDAMFNNLARKT